MKTMRRILSLVLVTVLILSMAGCGGNSGSGVGIKETNSAPSGETTVKSTEKSTVVTENEAGAAAVGDPTATSYKIAVAIPDYSTAQMSMFKKIYEEQIGPAFNVEFIFSEGLNNDISSEMQFMENARSSGAQGYITFNSSTKEHLENIIAKANDLQLICGVNGNLSENVNGLPNLMGAVDASADVENVALQFSEMTKILVGDGEKHNVVICTMGASVGSTQHIQSTAAALDALKEIYGLTYDDETDNMATAQSVTELSTGSDMKITLIPGPTPAVASDVEQVLKGGDYDVLICVGPQYSWYESVIKAVEDNLKIDIKTCSVMGISEATATSFHTEDATGHPSLDCALIKNASVADQIFVLVYNGLTGNPDAFKVDGKAQVFPNSMWLCPDGETYDLLSQVDASEDKACYSIDEMKSMLSAINPFVTADDFSAWCEIATADAVLEKLGLK